MKFAVKYKHIFFALLFILGLASPATSAVRAITDNDTCTPVVSIEVAPDISVLSYGLEEFLPPILIPSSINENGIWNAESRIIKWGPFTNNTQRTFTYNVTGTDTEYSVEGLVEQLS